MVEKFFPERLDTEQDNIYKKPLKSNVHKLFNDRNDIVHWGQKEVLTASYCEKIISSVRELVALEPRKAA